MIAHDEWHARIEWCSVEERQRIWGWLVERGSPAFMADV